MANLAAENFKRTLAQLKAFLATPVVTDRDRAGVIQAFEFTFEQSWKAIQKVAGNQGVTVGSPKQAYTFAIQVGWISNMSEQKWLKVIEDRNLTSHTYKEELAKQVLSRIENDYVSMFSDLLAQIEQA